MDQIDLHWLGLPHAIGTWRVGDVLIDCGPTSCLPRLIEAIGDDPPRALLLTHIHLDHAGAAGDLVRRWPDLIVYVHAIGAPHLVDPDRLVRSATRLYGDDMDRLWGRISPVPESNFRVLEGGESVEGFDVAYTPGHASHHVAFFDRASRRAFVGDATGVRIAPSELIMPHSPPPDIDLDAWFRSLDVIRDWEPESLGLPHYGVVEDVSSHLDSMRARLREKADHARTLDEESFVELTREEAATVDPAAQPVYGVTAPPDHMYRGLRRYWDKRGAT
jgi:glyoxylase-like metal-dependent hydrolase (beta-lactamase superfamily II)